MPALLHQPKLFSFHMLRIEFHVQGMIWQKVDSQTKVYCFCTIVLPLKKKKDTFSAVQMYDRCRMDTG